MKKYLPGIIASIMALGMFAFTEAPFKKMSGTSDPCGDGSKKWFTINYTCGSQTSVSDLRNPSNYIISNATYVQTNCTGSECVCAIWACPSAQQAPIITSSTLIYTELYNYFTWGIESSDIKMKDEISAGRRSQ